MISEAQQKSLLKRTFLIILFEPIFETFFYIRPDFVATLIQEPSV